MGEFVLRFNINVDIIGVGSQKYLVIKCYLLLLDLFLVAISD